MIKSPLRYPGGKSRAIKNISPIIPFFEEYREPFLGGGSLFVYLKQKYPYKKFWINDIYQNLFYFWKYCQIDPNKLINQIENWKLKFEDGKILYRFLQDKIGSCNELQKSAAFFVFNRITFSGTSESGGFSNSAFENRFTNSSIERVRQLSKILKNTKITNYDYQEVVEIPGKNVFIFLDPPYYSATKSALYGKNGNLHKTFDHQRFAEIMKKTTHKWLITYDDNLYIRNLFSFANINSWALKYGMRNVNKNSNQNAKELFISNFSLSNEEEKQLSFFSENILNNQITTNI